MASTRSMRNRASTRSTRSSPTICMIMPSFDFFTKKGSTSRPDRSRPPLRRLTLSQPIRDEQLRSLLQILPVRHAHGHIRAIHPHHVRVQRDPQARRLLLQHRHAHHRQPLLVQRGPHQHKLVVPPVKLHNVRAPLPPPPIRHNLLHHRAQAGKHPEKRSGKRAHIQEVLVFLPPPNRLSKKWLSSISSNTSHYTL